MKLINKNIEQIRKICELNSVENLFAFGSITNDEFNERSDIDLVVEIQDTDPLNYTDKYFNLKFALEKLLGRTIDLLESKAIRNKLLKKEIDQTKLLVYGK